MHKLNTYRERGYKTKQMGPDMYGNKIITKLNHQTNFLSSLTEFIITLNLTQIKLKLKLFADDPPFYLRIPACKVKTKI